ncbi:MAG TPA: SGNH/GDSL hydrolase family protein, partial [Bacteroidia bacterium]|nr:SGNH/GDSL hydrolase family protein [Bacteroidia bacterium]
MKRSIFCLCLLFVVLAVSPLRAEHEGKLQILLLGDSTTWGSIPRKLKPEGPHLETMIEQLLAAEGDLKPCRVINLGSGGESIHRLLDTGRYDKVVPKLPGLDWIFIRYGINDRVKREDFPENFPKDFKDLIARLRRDYPAARIVPTTVIPFADEEATAEINGLVLRVAVEEGLEVFDLHSRYAAELVKGPNMLNYRRFPVEKVPPQYQELVKPRVIDGRVVVMGDELDGLLGHLPGWFGDRHPNLAG